MAWDLDDRGMVPMTPLVSQETAIISDAACGMRLVLARPGDARGTGSVVVQVAMTIEQATILAHHLQRVVDRIIASSSDRPRPH